VRPLRCRPASYAASCPRRTVSRKSEVLEDIKLFEGDAFRVGDVPTSKPPMPKSTGEFTGERQRAQRGLFLSAARIALATILESPAINAV